MASKSGGTMPAWRGAVDANQAMALFDTVHHFRITRINREGRPGIEVKITHAGKGVSAQRRMFIDAFNAAMEKLKFGIEGKKGKVFILKLTPPHEGEE